MTTCLVCGGTDFICDAGFYFCGDCQTQSQDVRVVMDDGDGDEDEDFSFAQEGHPRTSGVSAKNSILEDETLTIWEGFNYALIGLVDELIKLGAKPELKLTVLQLWTKYLSRMEVAFFSTEMALPKLGPNFRKIDAKLIYGYSYKCETKSKKSSIELENSESIFDGNLNNTSVKQRILRKAKKAVIDQTYEKALLEMAATSQTLTNVTLDMLSSEHPEEDKMPKNLNKPVATVWIPHHPGLLLRNRLIAFLYLGILVCGDKIRLSDLLRWTTDGNLSYNSLWKFFPGISEFGSDNSSIFLNYQPTPPYNAMLKVTFLLAKYLQIQSVALNDPQDLIQHYVTQLNLPAQVGLMAKRLLAFLPTLPNHFNICTASCNSLPNIETRAMAHILVAMKLIFGLDDSTEYHNSNIARNINKLIKSEGGTTHLFVWDEWERYCTLRKTAFSMFHSPSFMKHDVQAGLSSIQNAEATISRWSKDLRPDSERRGNRGKIIKQTISSFLEKIEQNEHSSHNSFNCSAISLPASTNPYTSHVENIVNKYKKNAVAKDENEWGCVIRNFPFEKLSVSFRDASVEYLIHPEQFVKWAQARGLEVGLHTGSRASSLNFSQYEPFIKIRSRKFYRVRVYLDKQCESFGSEKPLQTRCLREYKFRKPLILPSSYLNEKVEDNPWPENHEMQITHDFDRKAQSKPQKKKNTKKTFYDAVPLKDVKNMLYWSNTEYWSAETCYPQSDNGWWEWKRKTIPLSFERLLEECAFLIEVKPMDLYKDVLNLEALHDDMFPSQPKTFPDCPTHTFQPEILKKWWCLHLPKPCKI